MNKTGLTQTVATMTGLTQKDTGKVIDAITETITTALSEGDKVQIVGFGAFSVKERADRIGRNPRTKEDVMIPATKTSVFKPGKQLKDMVAKNA